MYKVLAITSFVAAILTVIGVSVLSPNLGGDLFVGLLESINPTFETGHTLESEIQNSWDQALITSKN